MTPLTAIVLAGGRGARLGRLGRILPKALIAVSPTDTVLTRLLSQLGGAALPVLVTTNSEDQPLIDAVVRRSLGEAGGVTVVAETAHALGPVSGLRAALDRVDAERVLVCLSDIVFLSSPFAGGDVLLRDGLISGPLAEGRSGVVELDGDRVTRVAYRWDDFAPNRTYANWSGALSARASDLRSALSVCSNETLEDIVQILLENVPLTAFRAPGDFVNLNTTSELRSVWSKGLD